ncbi:MFS transporter [Streptomyces sp. DSM 44917]|uniref:MFS transporter n=1 Tax=Streptomyces boetiae TaxID=3075541 RepID=A0ABU2LFI9_9ACTN|nr:MFS transporter [Streptomyces sp. DSM 44917]MDT0310345.1 MFS transporter [Streptomyces sp. DSM 44917]
MPGAAPDDPRRWWALAGLLVSVLVLGVDATILNVGLPTLAVELRASTGEQQWFVDAFLLVFAAGLLPAGLLGDRYGRRRRLLLGLAVMTAGSLAGALAGTPALLIAARAVMGLGAALISPLSVAVLPRVFSPAERTRAIGAVTAALAAGLPLGPLLGGWLLDHHGWRWIFLINVPLLAVGMAACLLLPETRDPAGPRLRPLGSALVAGGLAALVFGLIEGPYRGWDDPLVPGALGLAVALFTVLALRQRRSPEPLLGAHLLRRPGFASNALIGGLVMFVLAGLLFVLPQYLQSVRGHDALGTGLRLLPMTAGVVLATRGCQPLVRTFGSRGVVATGLALLAFSGILGSSTEAASGFGLTAVWLTVAGLGAGLALVPAMDAALDAVPAGRSGAASALLVACRQVGGAIGVALLGSLLAQSYRGGLDTGPLPPAEAGAARESPAAAHALAERFALPSVADSADAAFMDGMSLVLFVCAIAALGAALLAGLLLPQHRAARDGLTLVPGAAARPGAGE